MGFHLVRELLEIHDLPDPRGGRMTWFMYPGLPPIHHYVPAGVAENSDVDKTYSWWDLRFVVAAMRYEALYEALSGHGKLSVQATFAEAWSCRDSG